MIVGTYHKKTRPGLYFGNRAQRDIDEATILSDARYRVLPDRRDCTVCGRPLKTHGRQRENAFYPCCSSDCRRSYQEWLNGV